MTIVLSNQVQALTRQALQLEKLETAHFNTLCFRRECILPLWS